MTVEYRTGDLFAEPFPVLAHGCNCAGVMGSGIAVEFRRRWPAMYDEYRKRCAAGLFTLGSVMRWESPDGRDTVFNLGTQLYPGPCADLSSISCAVTEMLSQAEHLGITAIGMPRIGAGLGGLAWPDVAEVIEKAAGSSQVRAIVFELPEGKQQEEKR